MALSKSTRILILLVVDILFFLIELVVGYIVGSLALIADSYHLLNDVLSLVIALYAIKLSSRSPSSRYSYGWHRAGILAALVNGVFLLALSFSILLSSIERFVKPEVVNDPRLVVIVGCIGLAANIFGLFLFHEHGHSHGGHSHSHSHSHEGSIKEPESTTPPITIERIPSPVTPTHRKRSNSAPGAARLRSDSMPSLAGHPVQTRASLREIAQSAGLGRTSLNVDSEPRPSPDDLEAGVRRHSHDHKDHDHDHKGHDHDHDHDHETKPTKSGHPHAHGGHSHGSMNMRGILLHVLGDALGNIGVIVSGLIIWLTPYEWRYRFDPLCSTIITIIIFCSAVPLVRSTSFILIQGVPSHISLDEVRIAIAAIPGILSIHEFHVWQLSEEKIVASLHILVSRNREYMTIAREVRGVMHAHGIHSGTIQPEFLDENEAKGASCLISCPPEVVCNPDYACCPPPPAFLTTVDEEPNPPTGSSTA